MKYLEPMLGKCLGVGIRINSELAQLKLASMLCKLEICEWRGTVLLGIRCFARAIALLLQNQAAV
jgi:hypothetical protein